MSSALAKSDEDQASYTITATATSGSTSSSIDGGGGTILPFTGVEIVETVKPPTRTAAAARPSSGSRSKRRSQKRGVLVKDKAAESPSMFDEEPRALPEGEGSIDESDDTDSDYSDSSASSSSSDDRVEDSSEEEREDKIKLVQCAKCARYFSTPGNLKLHLSGMPCRRFMATLGVGTQAVRLLKSLLDSGETTIITPESDISMVAPPPVPSDGLLHSTFCHGWASRPFHGRGKGHLYMKPEHQELFKDLFMKGEENSGEKKSAAGMLEVLEAKTSGKERHYLPGLSEVAPFISQMAQKRKQGKDLISGAGAGGGGRRLAAVVDDHAIIIEAGFDAYHLSRENGKPWAGALALAHLKSSVSAETELPKKAAVERLLCSFVERRALDTGVVVDINRGIELMGVDVGRFFAKHGWFLGKVSSFRVLDTEGLWTVTYADGDGEELTVEEMRQAVADARSHARGSK